VSWNQPGELTEQVISKIDLDQHVQLTKEEEDQDDIMMIGGIGVFLPCSQEEVEICVADGATIEQSAETVKEELEQVFETAQAQEEADEESKHSEEWLNDFSQEAEEVVALKMTAEGADKEDDEHSEEWLNIFNQEDEKTVTGEVA
jgi:hypothetical protein